MSYCPTLNITTYFTLQNFAPLYIFAHPWEFLRQEQPSYTQLVNISTRASLV